MSGATIRCGIVLHPAGHTRSPAMHRAAYRALEIDARYDAFDVPPEGLAEAMRGFRAERFRQLAVSIPHKQAVMAHVDEVEPVGREIGAINTVTRIGDRFVGTNTDWTGALRALERAGEVERRRAVVLGAGGAARAVVYGLQARGCQVTVLNRTVERAKALAVALGAHGAGPLEDLAALEPEILVNTTSVGLGADASPVPAAALPRDAVVMDAVYAPERTRLLVDAEARGNRTVGGKWMLVYQAVEQLRHWTAHLDRPPEEAALSRVVDVMAEAFDRAGGTSDSTRKVGLDVADQAS